MLTLSPDSTPLSVAPLKSTVALAVASYVLPFATAPLIVRPFFATVSVAAPLVTDPHEFVKTARYWLPLEATLGRVSVSVELVWAGDMSAKPEPEFTCHLTD